MYRSNTLANLFSNLTRSIMHKSKHIQYYKTLIEKKIVLFLDNLDYEDILKKVNFKI